MKIIEYFPVASEYLSALYDVYARGISMKIIDYQLALSESTWTLQAEVRNLISEGWQPFGSAFTKTSDYFNGICQPMVKYECEHHWFYKHEVTSDKSYLAGEEHISSKATCTKCGIDHPNNN
jgi:hypothetical protein